MSRLRLEGWLAGAALLLAVIAASLALGAKEIPLPVVLDALRSFDPELADHLIVQTIRLPRTVVGLVVGVALGIAGAVMQGLTRNPLADPGILGVEAGASLAVVVGIYVFGVGNLSGYVWFAFLGAGVVSVAVNALGSLGGGATPVKLALAGAAITALLGSITAAVLIRHVDALVQFRFWAVGSLNGRGWDIVGQVLPFAALGLLVAVPLGRSLNALALGDDMAAGLGVHRGLARVHSAVVVVLLTGAATAAAGPIGFVGLTVPHLARLLTGPDSVLLDGADIASLPTRTVATRLGLLPQTQVAPDGITVADLVARGRHPHHGWMRRWTGEDDAAVAAALRDTGTLELADRVLDELSGGQRQRVWIAMVLAQGTDLLLLDEPITYLDLAHQVDLLDLMIDLNRQRGRTVVMVLHDLNLAARYSDHLIAMKDGAVVASGRPAEVIDEALVAHVFGLECRVVPDQVSGTPLVLPIGRHDRRNGPAGPEERGV